MEEAGPVCPFAFRLAPSIKETRLDTTPLPQGSMAAKEEEHRAAVDPGPHSQRFLNHRL